VGGQTGCKTLGAISEYELDKIRKWKRLTGSIHTGVDENHERTVLETDTSRTEVSIFTA
jgi:hypothetical protein